MPTQYLFLLSTERRPMAVSAELTVAILGVLVTVPSAVLIFCKCWWSPGSRMLLPITSGQSDMQLHMDIGHIQAHLFQLSSTNRCYLMETIGLEHFMSSQTFNYIQGGHDDSSSSTRS